jgi:hypothetical protein
MLLRVTPCFEDSGDADGMRMRSGARILMVNGAGRTGNCAFGAFRGVRFLWSLTAGFVGDLTPGKLEVIL